MSYGTARSIIFGVYGGHNRGPAYIDGALAYGYSTFTTNRVIGTGSIGEVANASFDGYQYGGRIEGGWRFGFDRSVLTPFMGLTVQALTQPAYSETSRTATSGAPGLLGITVQGQNVTISDNPNNGSLAGNDTDLTFTAPAVGPIIATAYDRNFDRPNATLVKTTLYGIDRGSSRLVVQGGIDGAGAGGPNAGAITDVGPLGITLDATFDGGFDIQASSTTGDAAGNGAKPADDVVEADYEIVDEGKK